MYKPVHTHPKHERMSRADNYIQVIYFYINIKILN